MWRSPCRRRGPPPSRSTAVRRTRPRRRSPAPARTRPAGASARSAPVRPSPPECRERRSDRRASPSRRAAPRGGRDARPRRAPTPASVATGTRRSESTTSSLATAPRRRASSSAGGSAGTVRQSSTARASAGTTLRAEPPETTVGSTVARPRYGSSGPSGRSAIAARSRARPTMALRARSVRACAACAASPRATSSRTSSPFCATARSRPVGSPTIAIAGTRPRRSNSATTSAVPTLFVSSPRTSVSASANGRSNSATARKPAVIAATEALASLAPRPKDPARFAGGLVGLPRPPRRRRYGVDMRVQHHQRRALDVSLYRSFSCPGHEAAADPIHRRAMVFQKGRQQRNDGGFVAGDRRRRDELAVERQKLPALQPHSGLIRGPPARQEPRWRREPPDGAPRPTARPAYRSLRW